MTPCRLWTGARNSKGYGHRSVGGRMRYVHRLAWEAVNGPIPEGMTLDHLCLTKTCIEVSHLEVVSRATNVRRQLAHMRRDSRGRFIPTA